MMSEAEPIASIGVTLEEDHVGHQTILEAKPLGEDSKVSANPDIPSVSASAVLGESESLPKGTPQCRGHDFAESSLLDHIMESMRTTGFQATNVGLAIDQIKQLREWRLDSVPWKQGDDPELQSPQVRRRIRARIFFAYTSNQISSGQREVIRFLVQEQNG